MHALRAIYFQECCIVLPGCSLRTRKQFCEDSHAFWLVEGGFPSNKQKCAGRYCLDRTK